MGPSVGMGVMLQATMLGMQGTCEEGAEAEVHAGGWGREAGEWFAQKDVRKVCRESFPVMANQARPWHN